VEKTLGWLAVVLPALVVPGIAWAYRNPLNLKRSNVEERLTHGKTYELYRKAQHPGTEEDAEGQQPAERMVARLFDPLYSPRLYVFPLLMSFLLVVSGDVLALGRAGFDLGLPAQLNQVLNDVPAPVLAGLAGGYLWSLHDVLRRYRAIDLPPSSLNLIWLRFAIAAVVGYLAHASVKAPMDLLAAFAVGAFPVRTVRDLVQSITRKQFELTLEPVPAEPPNLQFLQGLSPEVVSRLGEEEITRCQHLANADPLSLFLKTSLPWNVILDIIDQAMLYNYSGDQITNLREIGVRSAIEVANISDCLKSDKPAHKKMAEEMVGELSRAFAESRPAALYIIDTIGGDPQVRLVWSLWQRAQRGITE
jgi:hypothetical protein